MSSYNGPFHGFDVATAIVASPDGRAVFVTGRSAGASDCCDIATVAYDSRTGARLWVSRLSGGIPSAIGISPDGGTVYVTGQDVVAVAYNAKTGARKWARRYKGPRNSIDAAKSLAVSPDGKTVYITGYSGKPRHYDYLTIAYKAATGARRWVSRYNDPANLNDFGTAVAVAPRGQVVYVTGGSEAPGRRLGWVTVAYKSSSGKALWTRRSRGCLIVNDVGSSVGVTPNGRTVMVAGYTAGTRTQTAYKTTAYNARTGKPRWSRRYAGPAGINGNMPSALGISPDGRVVYVTGTSDSPASEGDYATVAYKIATGARLRASRFTGLSNSFDEANALAVNPEGGAVYVTGSSESGNVLDFATVAYSTGEARLALGRR